jgi:hypothetical protein
MTRRIGGDLDMDALRRLHQTLGELHGYRPDLAEQHRPRDRRGYQRAAHDLARQGLKPADIAQSLGLSVPAVRELLAETPGEYAPRHRHRGTP